jgi:hypothetical protein
LYPLPQRTALHCTVLHCTALNRIASHRTSPHRTALQRTALHRIASHRTAPHRTAPYHFEVATSLWLAFEIEKIQLVVEKKVYKYSDGVCKLEFLSRW